MDEPPADRFEELTFSFERGTLSVAAEGEFDTVALREGGPTLASSTDLAHSDPWAEAVRCGPLWLWTLTNQQGFVDGFQAQFADGSGKTVSVQLMCAASSFSVARVVDVPPTQA